MNNTLTPVQFVKDNLPEYERRFKEAFDDHLGPRDYWDEKATCTYDEIIESEFPDFEHDFCWQYFPEALEACRDRIWREACEAMRKTCIRAIELADYGFELRALDHASIPEPPKMSRS